MTDDKRKDELSSLFDNALALGDDMALENSDLLDKLSTCEQRYIDLKFYKNGGSKVIYQAFDEMTGRQVALAQLKGESQPSQKDNFLREARLNALLQHPNIVPVYDLGLLDEQPFFCMKFIAGNSLEEILRGLQKGDKEMVRRFPLSTLIDIFLKICDAMAYAHSSGILHLDLKPENIRIDRFGDVLICDWGLAAIIDEMDEINDQFGSLEEYSLNKSDFQNMTIDGYIKGTPGYMAPEQTGQSSYRKSVTTDTYALGAVLYSLLTYIAPFSGDLEEVLKKTATGDFLPPSNVRQEVPSRLEAICLKAMQVLPEERYQTAVQLQEDILAYRNGYLTTAEETTLFKTFSLFIKRNKTVSIVTISSFILLCCFSAVFIHHLNQSRDEALEAKNKALDLAAKLQTEQDENRQHTKALSRQFVDKYKSAYGRSSFAEALIFINSAVRLDPENKQAWSYKAQLHCISFEFKQSLAAYEKSSERDSLYDIAKRFSDYHTIDAKLKIEIIKEVIKKYKYDKPTGAFIHRQVYSKMELPERLLFVKGMLKIFNPELKELNFRFDEKFGHLDISHNKELIWAYALQNFPAKTINLSHTPTYSLRILRSIPMLEMDASYTDIMELKNIQTQNLRVLNVAHSKIIDLLPLRYSPLQKLDIRHCEISSLEPVRKMKYLRTLIISPGQFTGAQLARLPVSIKVITRD